MYLSISSCRILLVCCILELIVVSRNMARHIGRYSLGTCHGQGHEFLGEGCIRNINVQVPVVFFSCAVSRLYLIPPPQRGPSSHHSRSAAVCEPFRARARESCRTRTHRYPSNNERSWCGEGDKKQSITCMERQWLVVAKLQRNKENGAH